jgi:hypothetical protein
MGHSLRILYRDWTFAKEDGQFFSRQHAVPIGILGAICRNTPDNCPVCRPGWGL